MRRKLIGVIQNLSSGQGSLNSRVLRGGFWISILKVSERFLLLVKTVVLARVLSPEDFGLFGVVLLVLSMLETFSRTGFEEALIQKKSNIGKLLNTAWTLQVLRSFALGAVLFLVAPIASQIFDVPEAIPIFRVIAVMIVLGGCINIKTVYFKKDLNFFKYFQFQSIGTITDVVISIILGLIFRNVWALVVGYSAKVVVRLIFSYIVEPYMPRLHFDKKKALGLWQFGKWLFVSNILVFLVTEGDDILVGKVLGVTALGLYQLAYRIANMPATEVVHVTSMVSFPAFAKLQNDIKRLREGYLKVMQVNTIMSFGIAGMIFAVADEFVLAFVGNQWVDIIPVVKILVIWGALRSVAVASEIANAVGKPRIGTMVSLIQVILLGIIIYPLTIEFGIIGTSWAVVLSSFLTRLLSGGVIIKILRCKPIEFVKRIVVPLVGMLLMVGISVLLRNALIEYHLIVRLVFISVTAGVCYLGYLLFVDKVFNYNGIGIIKEIFSGLRRS